MADKIPRKLRTRVSLRARGFCEYCFAPEDIIVSMQIDHVVPMAKGGETTFENLCLACVPCNRTKSDTLYYRDPQSKTIVPLFNPRTDIGNEHFEWSEDLTLVVGLTPTGRATVSKLKFNLPHICVARTYWLKAGWDPLQRE